MFRPFTFLSLLISAAALVAGRQARAQSVSPPIAEYRENAKASYRVSNQSNFPLTVPEHPKHVKPGGKAGHWKPGQVISVSGNCAPIALAREMMGIDWTTRDELGEAIPPYYTEHIGEQLRDHVRLASLQVS